MIDLIITNHRTGQDLRRLSNIKIDTAAREFMIGCALSLRTGDEIEMAVRPHDPRKGK